MADYETNPILWAWKKLPPEAKKAYGSLGEFIAEMSPGASIRDAVDESGKIMTGLLQGEGWTAAGGGAGLLTAMAGLVPGGRAVKKTAQAVAEEVAPAVARDVAKVAPKVDATLGTKTPDVVFNGKPPGEWTPAEWGAFGEKHGVPNLGPKSDEAFNKSLVEYTTKSGQKYTVPGGIDSDRPFTYYELLHLKQQGINPTDLDAAVHQKIHDRMVKSMQPGPGGPTDTQIANQTLFGLLSPNQPLTANELALQRAGLKGPQDLVSLAESVPYDYKTGGTPAAERVKLSNAVAEKLGVQAESKGGLGVSGSQDYTALAEFAQKMRDRPDFYRFNPDDPAFKGMSDSEKWTAHVERVLNETRGLKAKTGSLGAVWQAPDTAAISAIDRHMANKFRGEMFPDPASRAKWESETLAAFNKERPEGKKVLSIDEMRAEPGGVGHFVDRALAYVNALPTAVTRTKTGEFNPRIPPYLRNTDWVGPEPAKMQLVQGAYPRALEANQAEASKAGQGLFSNQWMLWDRIRQRLEPHEILFPGLEKLPRMSLDQMKVVDADLSAAGYKAAEGTVRPLPSASRAGYFSFLPVAGAGAGYGLLGNPDDDRAY